MPILLNNSTLFCCFEMPPLASELLSVFVCASRHSALLSTCCSCSHSHSPPHEGPGGFFLLYLIPFFISFRPHLHYESSRKPWRPYAIAAFLIFISLIISTRNRDSTEKNGLDVRQELCTSELESQVNVDICTGGNECLRPVRLPRSGMLPNNKGLRMGNPTSP